MRPVLASPLGNLLTEDMAKIRVAYPDVPFHESARMYASEEAQDPVLKDRLMRFFSQVDHFRKKVSYTPIHDLLTEIIEETGFGYIHFGDGRRSAKSRKRRDAGGKSKGV